MNLPEKSSINARLAIIEDNEDLRDELIFYLSAKGYNVWGADSAEAFWRQLHRSPVDIVLIDIGLPGEDGFSVIEYLNSIGHFGVIVLSARGTTQDKLRGLDLGADAYLIKPVNFSELADTITRLYRRICSEKDARQAAAEPGASHWRLTAEALYCSDGMALDLTPKEYGLLTVLYKHKNTVCKKEQVHDALFGFHEQADMHRVDVILSRLRRKARDKSMTLPVRAVFGQGLVFTDADQEAEAQI